jgi:hypothetical protein
MSMKADHGQFNDQTEMIDAVAGISRRLQLPLRANRLFVVGFAGVK